MADIKEAIRRVSDIVGEIATASEERNHSIQQGSVHSFTNGRNEQQAALPPASRGTRPP
ncbi:hypothetical protein [Paraburkholderia ultramafica]|uniref:hypothetical protein n=1 Tax=Paraburkholderia ultramafica TaxID=1544867 RepID=UPI001581CE68|nr:hypothetical protein [Paraburkholderia ultramafica]